jgi:hypothetical protein
MVVFLTLFLGLTSGMQPVEVQVEEAVAQVTIELDGRPVTSVAGPPWLALVNFGAAVVPHTLDAVAYDADGRELDRTRQWVNLPRDPAETTLLLTGEEDGEGIVAQLNWQTVFVSEPTAVRVTLDGVPIEVADPRRFSLPDLDPERMHFLRAEVDFAEGVHSMAELVFGGLYTDEVNTELTGLPVLFDDPDAEPSPAELEGWFVKDGDPLRVVAIEEGPVEIVAVLDQAIWEAVDMMARVARGRAVGTGRSADGRILRLAPLRKTYVLRFIAPFSEDRQGDGASFDLFRRSEDLSGLDGGFFFHLTRHLPRGDDSPQRLADAVAVAGMSAASRDRRRAVVLLTTGQAEDASHFTGRQAREYLEALRVPLRVWSVDDAREALLEEWGEAAPSDSLSRLEKQVKRLVHELDRQRIVWLDGVHLPQSIELSPESTGASIAR